MGGHLYCNDMASSMESGIEASNSRHSRVAVCITSF